MEVKYNYSDGHIYEGLVDVDTGIYNGYGKLTYPNGDTYEGDFLLGKCHGKGVYIYKNINCRFFPFLKKYEGDFTNNHFNGYATITLYDGFEIKCKFINNDFVLDDTFSIGTFEQGNYKLINNGVTYKILYSDTVIFEGSIIDSKKNIKIMHINPATLLDFTKIKL